MTATDPLNISTRQAADQSPTVFVVDDDVLVLDLIRRVCTSIQVDVRTFSEAQSFLTAVNRDQAGCIVLDYLLDGIDGFQVLNELKDAGVKMPVIFISGKADIPTAVQAMQLGSLHFLEKPFDHQQLKIEIRKALERDVHDRERRLVLGEIDHRIHSLTPREREVAELVVAGSPNKVTAERLGVSPKTIEVHRAAVMRKMGAASLPELVTLWIFHRDAGDTGEETPVLRSTV